MPPPSVRAADWQILQAIHRLGAVPQHKLAEITGRQRSTINGAVQRLLASNWLVRTETTAEGRGRPAIPLAVNKELGAFVGVDLGGEELRFALVGADGVLLGQASATVGKDRSVAVVLDQVDLNLRGLLSRYNFNIEQMLGLWVGVNGAVDAHGNVVTSAAFGWRNVPLRERMAQRYGCDALVQGGTTVMNAAAEWLMGAGREAESLVYFHAGRGVGARYLARGQHFAGATQRAGELGHVVVDPNGPQCACGHKGCLEAVASGPAIAAVIREMPADEQPEEVRKLLRRKTPVKSREIVQAAVAAAEDGNAAMTRLFDELVEHLAIGAAMAVAAYDPEVLVLGGYVFEENVHLFTLVEDAMRAKVLDGEERDLRVTRGEVMTQDRAVPGAAEVCQRFWANPRGVVSGAIDFSAGLNMHSSLQEFGLR